MKNSEKHKIRDFVNNKLTVILAMASAGENIKEKVYEISDFVNNLEVENEIEKRK